MALANASTSKSLLKVSLEINEQKLSLNEVILWHKFAENEQFQRAIYRKIADIYIKRIHDSSQLTKRRCFFKLYDPGYFLSQLFEFEFIPFEMSNKTHRVRYIQFSEPSNNKILVLISFKMHCCHIYV